jgi:hypothetical protein
MTKKDYDLIAEAIRNVGLWYHVGEGERQHGSGVVLFSLAMELARELAAANPRFDQERFMTACEVAA